MTPDDLAKIEHELDDRYGRKLQRVSVDMTRIARCMCTVCVRDPSDWPKVRPCAGGSVPMQPAVRFRKLDMDFEEFFFHAPVNKDRDPFSESV